MNENNKRARALELAKIDMLSVNSNKYRAHGHKESNFRAIRLGMDNPHITAYLVALHEGNVSEIDEAECKKALAEVVNMAAEHCADVFMSEL